MMILSKSFCVPGYLAIIAMCLVMAGALRGSLNLEVLCFMAALAMVGAAFAWWRGARSLAIPLSLAEWLAIPLLLGTAVAVTADVVALNDTRIVLLLQSILLVPQLVRLACTRLRSSRRS